MTGEGLHCYHPDLYDEYGEETGAEADCVCCECCCTCLACEYGPRDGLELSAEQRAPIVAVALDYDDVPPNAGSAS